MSERVTYTVRDEEPTAKVALYKSAIDGRVCVMVNGRDVVRLLRDGTVELAELTPDSAATLEKAGMQVQHEEWPRPGQIFGAFGGPGPLVRRTVKLKMS